MTSKGKRKKYSFKPKAAEVDYGGSGGDEAQSLVAVEEEDDCAVRGDDDFDKVGDGGDEVDDGNGRNEVLVEEICNDFVEHFGEAARDEDDGSDADSGDEIWDDEKIPDPLSSDSEDEDTEEEKREGRRVERATEDPDVILELGKTFNSPEDFKHAVLRYSLKTRYDIKLYRSQSMKIGAKCSDIDVKCPWKVYCSYEKRKHKMQIKVFVNEHICVRSGYSKMLKCSTIAWLYSERLRVNPKITKQEMAAEIKREFNLVVTDDQCGNAKAKVMKEKRASHEAHFARVWDYQEEVLNRNPRTTFDIETIPGATVGSKQRFDRCYVCFTAQRESWKSTCRPIIGLDGAFLKWDIKGHLLAAVGRDGDNRIVPIAWAVVEIENDINWEWFVRHLSRSLELGDGRNVAIISDKHKGLVKAVHNILPEAEHRQCCKHIMDNWKRDNHDMELQRLFWKIARSYTTAEFIEHMEALKRYNPHAYASLQLTKPESWSRAYFRIGSLCNDNLNNLSESFNRTIRQARKKPLLDLLEDIRRQCMVRNAKRFIIADRLKTRFTKRAHIEIEKMIAGSQHCIRHLARNDFHEVELNGVGYTVDMNTLTCGCRKWQMVGIPCVHATSVIIGKRQKVEDYVHDFYTARMWQETYRDGIKPVQGMKMWPTLNRLPVLPPPWRKGNPGRPSNYARKKGKYESLSSSSKTKLSRALRVMTCSNCLEDGHNKQGCKNPTVQPPPKRPRGRPRKFQEGSELGGGSQPQASQQGTQTRVSQRTRSQPQGSQTRDSQPQGSQTRHSQPQGSQTRHSQPQGSQTRDSQPQGSQTRHSQPQGSQRQGSQGWRSWFECSN